MTVPLREPDVGETVVDVGPTVPVREEDVGETTDATEPYP